MALLGARGKERNRARVVAVLLFAASDGYNVEESVQSTCDHGGDGEHIWLLGARHGEDWTNGFSSPRSNHKKHGPTLCASSPIIRLQLYRTSHVWDRPPLQPSISISTPHNSPLSPSTSPQGRLVEGREYSVVDLQSRAVKESTSGRIMSSRLSSLLCPHPPQAD